MRIDLIEVDTWSLRKTLGNESKLVPDDNPLLIAFLGMDQFATSWRFREGDG